MYFWCKFKTVTQMIVVTSLNLENLPGPTFSLADLIQGYIEKPQPQEKTLVSIPRMNTELIN